MDEKTVIDLFSGIGGFSLGLESVGPFRTVAFCERNKFCRGVLRKHWPNVPIYTDIKTFDYSGRCDVITSGDPCQKDSRANAKRDGESMWPYAMRQIRRLKPFYVIRENVLGNIETGTLEQVESELNQAGYNVRSYIIHAASLGAAHDRPRTWTLAYSNSARREKRNHAAKSSTPQQREYPVFTGPNGLCWVGSKPPVLRRVDDVSHRLHRIKCLGNSVYIPIVEEIGRAILAAEGQR